MGHLRSVTQKKRRTMILRRCVERRPRGRGWLVYYPPLLEETIEEKHTCTHKEEIPAKKKKRKKWGKRTTLFSYLSGPGKEDGKVRNGWSRASCCRREEEGKRRSVRGEVCCE